MVPASQDLLSKGGWFARTRTLTAPAPWHQGTPPLPVPTLPGRPS